MAIVESHQHGIIGKPQLSFACPQIIAKRNYLVMTSQILQLSAESIRADMQAEAIIRMSRRPMSYAVITESHHAASVKPCRQAYYARPVEEFKSESLQKFIRRARSLIRVS